MEDQISKENDKAFFVNDIYQSQESDTVNLWWKCVENFLKIEEKEAFVVNRIKRIESKYLITKKDQRGNGIIHYAARTDSKLLADHLLHVAPAVINHENYIGQGPIVIAVIYNSPRVLELLLQKSEDFINKSFGFNFKLLHIAVYCGALECLDVLIQAGVDVNDLDCDDWSPLHVAVGFDKCRKNSKNVLLIKKLLSSEISVNKISKSGQTALHLACKHGYVDGVDELLAANAETEIRDICEKTPIFYALDSEKLSVVRLMIEARVDLNVRLAVYHNGPTLHRTIPFFYANERISSKLDDFMNTQKPRNSEVLRRLHEWQYDMTKLFMEAGFRINRFCCNDGVTIINHACKFLNLDLIKLLLVNGAVVNNLQYNLIIRVIHSILVSKPTLNARIEETSDTVIESYTSLEMIDLQVNCLKLLIRGKVNVNSPEHDWKPIFHAIVWSHSRVVRLLLNNGAVFSLDDLFPLFDLSLITEPMCEVAKYAVKIFGTDGDDERKRIFEEILSHTTGQPRLTANTCMKEIELMKMMLCGKHTYWNLFNATQIELLFLDASFAEAIDISFIREQFTEYGVEFVERITEARDKANLIKKAKAAFWRMKGWSEEQSNPRSIAAGRTIRCIAADYDLVFNFYNLKKRERSS